MGRFHTGYVHRHPEDQQGFAIRFRLPGLTFLFISLRDFTYSETIGMIAGIEGIICGLLAIYTGLAQVLNEVYGKTVLPIYPF